MVLCPRCNRPLHDHSKECRAQAKAEARVKVKSKPRQCHRCTFDPRRTVQPKCLDCLEAHMRQTQEAK